MSRNSSGVYSKPAGTTALPNTTIASGPFNTLIDDIVGDLNTARPITAGGTGANTSSLALKNIFAGAALSTDDATAARATLGVLPDREFYRSTSLVGVSALTIDIPDDISLFEMEFIGISSQSGTSGVYLRCGNAGGTADAGASDYYVNRADILSTSSTVVPSNAFTSALQIFNVITDSQARASLRCDTGGASSRWGFSGDFRTSDASAIAAGSIFGRRLGAGRKPRLFILTDTPFGGGTIIVRGRP